MLVEIPWNYEKDISDLNTASEASKIYILHQLTKLIKLNMAKSTES